MFICPILNIRMQIWLPVILRPGIIPKWLWQLILNDWGLAGSGIIVRHLVLPGVVPQSIDVLRLIASELSPKLHVSLMSQYFPMELVRNNNELNRTISPEEYKQVVDAFYEFGFYRGWIQDLESQATYRPDFLEDQPFL